MRLGLHKELSLFLLCFFFLTSLYADPLPSWNNGPTKQSIINFVTAVTDQKNKSYVDPKDRIATIDDDGTLWVEQPMYTQQIFIMDRFKGLLAQHPEWKQVEPYKSIVANAPHFTKQNLETIFAAANSQISVEDFHQLAKQWLATSENPHFKHRYTELVYQPMLEVINYLHANQFHVYIVSGGGQDFMRAFAETTYQIPIEKIIGSTTKTEYIFKNGQATLMKLPQILLISDKTGKPEAINLFIGKKPIIAFGNSDGDQQMLEWTQSNPQEHLMLLVHHDDAKREYAYDTQSKVGTFSTALMNEANKNNWHVISMKNDWKVIFPFESKLTSTQSR